MMRKSLYGLSTALFLVGACSGVSVRSDTAPGANLGKYRSYAYFTSPYKQGQSETLADQHVRAALDKDLAAKGLTLATTNPDFLVAYHKIEQQKLAVQDVGYGPGWGWGGVPDVTTYTQGTLVVDFIDPATNKVFWRGTATAVVDHPDNPNPAKIDKAVAKLVNQYPSMRAAATRPTL